ncbi:MAG: Bax inhibitor-1/YccA family protein [Parachlamydiales bacterium]|nr:Bax inhibitor-1/YccA family protein [Parachlamydiales bacterium]
MDYYRNQVDSRVYEKQVSTFATKVYGWLTFGLGITAVVAYLIVSTKLFMYILPFWWVATGAAFIIGMSINMLVNKLSFPTLSLLFSLYAVAQGVFFGTVLPMFISMAGGQVVWTAFATAAVIYGAAVLYGTCTKSDLTSMGKILWFAVIGLIGLTLLQFALSFFMTLTKMQIMISYLGLAIFVGLSAFQAQQIRQMAQKVDGNSVIAYKMALMMAFQMYVNVIMIFWYLLQIFSSQKK